MRRSTASLACLTLLVSNGVFACDDFSKYPAKVENKNNPSKVNLKSHPKAREFRTVLREGAKNGPNFAGHFTLVTWGCGSACFNLAVVDSKNGSVYFSRVLKGNEFQAVHDESDPIKFKLESSLLVIEGSTYGLEEPPERTGEFCYFWNGNEFKELEWRPKTWPEISNTKER